MSLNLILGRTALVVAVGASSAGCSTVTSSAADVTATAIPAERVFTGKLANSDALIGLSIDQSGEFTAYVCDGPPGGPGRELSVTTWFGGAVGADTAAATAPGAEIDVKFAGGRATGTVTLDGTEYTFKAVGATGPANLYRGVDPPAGVGRRGLIVLADGSERGTAYPAYASCRLPVGAGKPACP